MKLSEKGIEKVQNYSSVDLEIEGFEPDDFENVVVLTVEEAKGIYETIEEAKEFLWKYHKVPLTKLGQKDFDTLKKRIEQASGSFQNGNDHSNQSVKKDEMTLDEAKEFLIVFQNLIK